MKFVTTDIRVLMITLVIASAGGTFAIVQGLNIDLDAATSPAKGGAFIVGNVKATHFDENGNIIGLRQSDNHIVLAGMEVIMAQVFGDINGTYPGEINDSEGLVHPVRFMQIGTDGERRLLHNDTSIMAPDAGCLRQQASITNTSAQGAHGAPPTCDDIGTLCSAQMNVTATASFLGNAGCNLISIDEAGIYTNATTDTVGHPNSNGGGLMFARNTFGSVTLNLGDTLQLDWEFTFTDS